VDFYSFYYSGFIKDEYLEKGKNSVNYLDGFNERFYDVYKCIVLEQM
jgi:hypothetical protein